MTGRPRFSRQAGIAAEQRQFADLTELLEIVIVDGAAKFQRRAGFIKIGRASCRERV